MNYESSFMESINPFTRIPVKIVGLDLKSPRPDIPFNSHNKKIMFGVSLLKLSSLKFNIIIITTIPLSLIEPLPLLLGLLLLLLLLLPLMLRLPSPQQISHNYNKLIILI